MSLGGAATRHGAAMAPVRWSHRQAVLGMVVCTLMWSIAGVVSRHFQAAQGFEVTFWRAFFTVVSLVGLLSWMRGPAPLWRSLRSGGSALWLSGACWCVMFVTFMLALTLTTVANVLITMSVGPLFTAIAASVVLRHRLPARTWAAIIVAGGGITWMFGSEVSAAGAKHLAGMAVALGVPVAAAINWTLLQSLRHREHQGGGARDMLPAVLLGAVMASMVTLPMALPFAATGRALALLALLGLVQLAIPCLLSVSIARTLSAPEISLLGLLEVIFGVAWAWWGAGEAPAGPVLAGGTLVLVALAANEAVALRQRGR